MQDTTTTPRLVASLPGRFYYAQDIYEREIERIFGGRWVGVERAERVQHAGDFIRIDVGDENILIVRGRDDSLRAFYNVCRHRGARVCGEADGTARAFTCAYHAWTYGLDGHLQGAPNIATLGDIDRQNLGLVPLAVEVWEGLMWLNMSAQPAPLRDQVLPALRERFGDPAQFARYGLGDLRLGRRLSYDVHANWKLVVENFLECYHCAPMHPEFCALLPGFYGGGSYQEQVGVGVRLADGVGQFSLSGKERRPRLPGLRDEDDRQYFGFTLAPNVLVSLLPDHVVIHLAHPRGPQHTVVTCDWLFDPAVVTAPDFDPIDTVATFDLVNQQDWQVCELTQQGVRSKAFAAGGVYVPAEHDLARFNQLVLDWLELPAER